MYKDQFKRIKEYKKRKRGIITIRNIVIVIALLLVCISIGYSYWGTTLKITGTVTAFRESSAGNGGTWSEPIIDSSTNTYDADDVPEGTTKYSGITGEPQVTKENGKITRFEYMNPGTNGITTPASGGIDTGVLAFDGVDFTVTLKGKFAYDSKALNPIIVMSSKVGNAVEGVVLFNSKNKQKYTSLTGTQNKSNADVDRFRTIRYNGGTLTDALNLSVSGTTSTSNVVGNLGYKSADAPVTVTLVMKSVNKKITAELYNSSGTKMGVLPNNFQYDFSSSQLDDITIELGHWVNNAGTVYDYSFTILEFSIVKS